MAFETVTRGARTSTAPVPRAKERVSWRESALGLRDALSYRCLRMLSHARNRLSEEEVASRTVELPFNPAKARKHVDFFSRYTDFRGKRIVDIGCGYGDVAIGLAKVGARKVLGVDLDPARVECARRNAHAAGVSQLASFECMDFVRGPLLESEFDHVISIASFEHILDLKGCLRRIYDILAPGGSLMTRFGPLWFSPYGAHMFDFTRVPWVHLLFPESVVLQVRAECFRPGQVVDRYEDIVGHLNRVSACRFKAFAAEAGLKARVFRLNPEKDTKWLGLLRPFNSLLNRTPGLRELGALTLLAVLDKPTSELLS